jgi:hypothetical protein
VLLLGLAGPGAPVLACSNGNCPVVSQSQEDLRSRGRFRLDLAWRYMDQDRLAHRGELAPRVDFERGELLPGHHQDRRMKHRMFQLEASYGLTGRVTAFASLPVWSERSHEQYELALPGVEVPEHTHAPLPPGAVLTSFVSRHASSGLGDLQVGLGAALGRGLVARAAVELPTGPWRRLDRFATVDRPDLQPGSGSTDVVLGLTYRRPLSGGWSAFGSAGYQRNGTNDLRYSFGDDASLAAGLGGPPRGRLRWSVQVAARRWARDRFRDQPVSSTGARTLSLVPGLRVGGPRGADFYAYVKLPVLQHGNEGLLLARIDFITGMAFGFRGSPRTTHAPTPPDRRRRARARRSVDRSARPRGASEP